MQRISNSAPVIQRTVLQRIGASLAKGRWLVEMIYILMIFCIRALSG